MTPTVLSKLDEFVTCLFFQDSKKFFKRADLVRKEQEEYFKRCGYKVCATWKPKVIFVHTSVSILIVHLSRTHDPFWCTGLYECLCLLCCFSKPASAACICRFRERLLRTRYGWKSLTGCMMKGQKSVHKPSISLTPFLKFHFGDNYNGIMLEVAL